MKMRTSQNAVCLSLWLFVVAAPFACAQQEQQPQQPEQVSQQQTPEQASGPIPAYRSPLASAAGDDQDDEGTQEVAPDNRSLSGAQNLSLGIPTTRTYWQPHFDVAATADSNALETANSAGWGAWASISGGVDVHRASGNNNMTLSYTSGGMFSNYTGISNGIVQGLSFSERIGFRRWSVLFLDNLSYLPESSFGFGGLAGGLTTGGSSLGSGTAFTPGLSLLTGYGQNLENSFATEVDTFLTPRSSITFVGGYSLLHYFDSDLLDFGDFNLRIGYNYEMSRRDTLAVFYTFGGIRYSNFNQSIDSHTAQISYGRRVTGRLAFQVAGGPQILVSSEPITGSSMPTTSNVGTSNFTQLYWTLNTALSWQLRRTGLGFSYNHSATGGSGVLAGAITDIVTGSATRQVSRTFSDGLNVGYSRNKGVAVTGPTAPNETYDYWFVRASLSHPMGQSIGLTLSYQLQYQNSNTTFCIGPSCGTDVIRHLITVGVGWHEHPLLF